MGTRIDSLACSLRVLLKVVPALRLVACATNRPIESLRERAPPIASHRPRLLIVHFPAANLEQSVNNGHLRRRAPKTTHSTSRQPTPLPQWKELSTMNFDELLSEVEGAIQGAATSAKQPQQSGPPASTGTSAYRPASNQSSGSTSASAPSRRVSERPLPIFVRTPR